MGISLPVLLFVFLKTAVGVERLVYPWTVNVSRGLLYHNNFCQQRCDSWNGISHLESSTDCFSCSCARTCRMYGTCCPTVDTGWARNIFHVLDTALAESAGGEVSERDITRIEETFFDFKAFDCLKMGGRHILVANRCPAGEKNSTLRSLCAGDLPPTMKSSTPLSERTTGVTFRNIYCLVCHVDNFDESKVVFNYEYANGNGTYVWASGPSDDQGEGIYVEWSLEIVCEHFQTLYGAMSVDELLRGALKESEICKIILRPPPTHAPETCTESFFPAHDYKYKECAIPDPRLLWYCLHITHPSFRTSSGHNLFCLLCNGSIPFRSNTAKALPRYVVYDIASTRDSEGRTDKVSPISFLLGVTRRPVENQVYSECSNITWRDEEGKCQSALCSAGKLVRQDGTCSSVLQEIGGLGYVISAVLVPVDRFESSSFQEMGIHNEIYKFFRERNLMVELRLHVNVSVKVDPTNKGSELLNYISFKAYIISDSLMPRDAFETKMLEAITGEWTLLSEYGKEFMLRRLNLGYEAAKSMDMVHSTPATYSIYQPDTHYSRHTYFLRNVIVTLRPMLYNIEYGFLNVPLANSSESETQSVYNETKNYIYSASTRMWHEKLWNLTDLFIDFTHSILCPFIIVNITHSFNDDLGTETFVFENEHVYYNVSYDQSVSLVNGQLRICIELFKQLVPSPVQRVKQDLLTLVEYYFEITCFSVSVACLLVSFLTYCIFPALRTLPGLNNMSLCISLAVAQISLLVTVRYGVQGKFHPIHCIIHAIILHYTWLAAIAWMSVCCIHMFRVFTSSGHQVRQDTSSRRKRYIHHCLYAFGSSAVIVLLTVVLNLLVSHGDSFGYDTKICFLDTSRSILTIVLSLLGPMCLMVLSNGVLFVFTVRKIVHVTRLQKEHKKQDRRGVITYVKLSTVTGIFCVVAVAAVQVGNPIFNLITAPTMALQGVFIFFSFIVNKRVGRLYWARLGLRKWSRHLPSESYTGISSNSAAIRTTTVSVKVETTNT